MTDEELLSAVEDLIHQVAQIDQLRQENKELRAEIIQLTKDKAFWQKKAKEKKQLAATNYLTKIYFSLIIPH